MSDVKPQTFGEAIEQVRDGAFLLMKGVGDKADSAYAIRCLEVAFGVWQYIRMEDAKVGIAREAVSSLLGQSAAATGASDQLRESLLKNAGFRGFTPSVENRSGRKDG